jgi:hypothetical protein
LLGTRIHIAGSASKTTSEVKRSWAHGFVEDLTNGILARGGGLVLQAGKEPSPPDSRPDAPALVFDWSALTAAAAALANSDCVWPKWAGPRVVIATSQKAEGEIPASRGELWSRLIARNDVEVMGILPGSRSASMIRQRQASYGSALVVLGGGTGVEHLAELYRARRRSVVALDLQLGASRDDGTGGGPMLSAQARAHPEEFVYLAKSASARAGTMLAAIATRDGAAPVPGVAEAMLQLIEALAPPRAFYVRLLHPGHPAFPQVERFFRGVVDVAVAERGMERAEVGTDPSDQGFINVEIFTRLHHADMVVADLTGERPNCLIELGYALRSDAPVLLAARDGTPLPFDGDKIPCHFWDPNRGIDDELAAFRAFWDKHYGRGPIVRTSSGRWGGQ